MTEGGGEKLVARCHCGQVAITLPYVPDEVSQCNCSLCRKTGFMGIYYRPDEIAVSGDVDAYVRRDLDEACLTNWRCRHCGCPTHWTGLGQYADARMGVNARMLDTGVLDGVPVKAVDGASW
nr:GFA family protein [uncultured Sphingomonas sp.]